jgi:UvrD-like helicase C-terminal domain/AAA domain
VSDETVRAALRSDATLVAIEAPAGCGKTHQGADYARDIIRGTVKERALILTHTHAACSVFAEHTRDTGSQFEIRTIDSVIARIASGYHVSLGIPPDPSTWVRQRKDGYAELAVKVASLVRRHPMIPRALARRYPIVICDEHQDSSGDQHALAMSLHEQGARMRIFADPMQKIFRDDVPCGASQPCEWDQLLAQAHVTAELDHPHRWDCGCPQLGAWTLKARAALKAGGKVDLRQCPPSIHIAYAENQAQRNLDYRLSSVDRTPIDTFERRQSSLLILTRHNDTARATRSVFDRRIPLWEGHTRPALEKLISVLSNGSPAPDAIARAIVSFMGDIGKGFSPSAFGDRFEREVRDGCTKVARGKPATIQLLARFITDEPDHRGVAKVLRRLAELCEQDAAFSDIEIDCRREFWEAVRLGAFDNPDTGFAEITHRRTYARPKPPARAISTIHKAKGLECESVIIMPCDGSTFPDKPDARCLLYVALTRARSELMLVVSRNKPSPLLLL